MPVRSAGTSGSRPSTLTCPWVGGSAVASRRSRVVLPAPLGPSSPVTPGFRSRLTSASARVAPNVRPASRRLIEAVTIATSTVEAGAGGAGAGEKSRTKPPPAPGRPPEPGRRGQDPRDEADRRQQPGARFFGGYEQPEQQHHRQREHENRDRAQQDQ